MEIDNLIALIVAIFASTGFWAFLTSRFQSRDDKQEKEMHNIELQLKMLKGLGHDRIIYLGSQYIKRGYITKDEYENLNDYLFVPYKEIGGNGTAEKVMKEVDKLPIREHS